MTYLPLGQSTMERAGGILAVGAKLLDDPYLPEVTCLTMRISALEEGRPPGPPCRRTPPNQPRRGLGLREVITPLRWAAKSKEHRWLLPAAVGGAVLGSFALGYLFGREK